MEPLKQCATYTACQHSRQRHCPQSEIADGGAFIYSQANVRRAGIACAARALHTICIPGLTYFDEPDERLPQGQAAREKQPNGLSGGYASWISLLCVMPAGPLQLRSNDRSPLTQASIYCHPADGGTKAASHHIKVQ